MEGRTPISYNGDPCSYKYLELPNGLKVILISEKLASIENGNRGNYSDENEELCMSISSMSVEVEDKKVKPEVKMDVDISSVEGQVCLTFECGSIHDAGYCPGIGDLCRQMIEFYDLDPDACPTSKIDLGQTTFYHIKYAIELDAYLNCLAQIMRKPIVNRKHIRQFITNPKKSTDWYFKDTFEDKKFQITNEVELFMIYKWYELFQNISPSDRKCLAQYASEKSDDDIFKLVEKYWNEFYMPRKASIVVKSNASLTLLENLIQKHFSSLENRDVKNSSIMTMKITDPIIKCHKWMEFQNDDENDESDDDNDENDESDDDDDEKDEILGADEHTLLISWILSPEYWTEYMAKPHLYISWILNNQGKKSVAQILYKNDWATNIRAGCQYSSYHRNDLSTMFQIRIKLTDKGLEQKDEVLACVFTAIRNVGVNKDIFEQVKLTTVMSFRKFDYQSLPYKYIPCMYLKNLVHISSAISKFPPEQVIIGELILGDFDSSSEIIEKFRRCLAPQSADFILISPTARIPNTVEKYFHTNFFHEDVKQSLVDKWNSPSKFFDINNWKVTKLNMYDEQNHVLVVPLKPLNSYFPKKLTTTDIKSEFYEIWHKQDPRAKEMVVIGLHLISSVTRRSPLNEVLCELMAKFLNKCLISELFDTTHANYRCKCEETVCGIMITIMGPRFQISSVVAAALNIYQTLQKSIEELPLCCNRIYNDIEASLKQKLQKGKEIVRDIMHSLLIRNHHCIQDKYTAITVNPLNISKFKRFVTNFQKKIYGFFYIHGNFTEHEAATFVESYIADKIFTSKEPINIDKTMMKSVLWPVSNLSSPNVVRVDTVNAWTGDALCEMHFHCGYANASNIALAKVHLELLRRELGLLPYALPFPFTPGMRVIHGALDCYFKFTLDEKSMDISQEVFKLQTLRSKFLLKLELFFHQWYSGFRKRISDLTIMDCISSCKNDHYNAMDNLQLNEEVNYFLEKVKFLDFDFSILDNEEKCFTKFELELSHSRKYREEEQMKDSVREWVKRQFFNEVPDGETTSKIFIILQKSARPLIFDFKNTNSYDLIKFKIEDADCPSIKYIDNFQTFKQKSTTLNRSYKVFDDDEEDEEEEDENCNYYYKKQLWHSKLY